jgi:hypothetical protein
MQSLFLDGRVIRLVIFFFPLADRDLHHADGVPDHVRQALLAFRSGEVLRLLGIRGGVHPLGG